MLLLPVTVPSVEVRPSHSGYMFQRKYTDLVNPYAFLPNPRILHCPKEFPTSWYLALSLCSQDNWCKFCSIIGLGRPTLLGGCTVSLMLLRTYVTSYCNHPLRFAHEKKLHFFFPPSHSGYMFQRKYCTAHASSYVATYKYLSVREKQHLYYRFPCYVRTVKTVQMKRFKKPTFGSKLDA